LTSITPPTTSNGTQLGTTQLAYNPMGQVSSITDGRNDTTSYLWNGENEITQVTYNDDTQVRLGYDSDGNLTSETAPGGTSSFGYNPASLLKSSDINGDSTSYVYNLAGDLHTMDGPLGDTTYYDSVVNLVKQVVDPWGGTTNFTFKPNNDRLVQNVDLPGQVTEAYGYDNAHRVTSYTVTGPNSSLNPLISDSYSYFTSGGADANLLQSFTNTENQTTNYSYDPLERLTSASGGAVFLSS
jgi:YD repeat-containing protein